MKNKFIAIIFLLSGTHFSSQAQSNYSSDLRDIINLGTSSFNMTGEYADAGGGGNWGTAMGSPSYSVAGGILTKAIVGSTNTQVAFKRYHFYPNTNYKIFIGLKAFLCNCDDNQPYSISVLLANNIQANSSNGPAPVFSSSRTLYFNTFTNAGATTPPSSDEFLGLQFTTGPTEDFEGIVIYPGLGNQTGVGNNVDLQIGCIEIDNCMQPGSNLYYSSTTIPYGMTRGENVFIGSSYGTTASLTSSDPNNITAITANNTITIANNTTLTANNSNSISLSVDGNDCEASFATYTNGEVVPEWVGGTCAAPGRPAPTNINTVSNPLKGVIIAPNPSIDNEFFVVNPLNEKLKITLYNLNGGVLDDKTVMPDSKQKMQYPNLSKGIYYLKIVGTDGESKTEKIVFN